jgi:hypothetical protein
MALNIGRKIRRANMPLSEYNAQRLRDAGFVKFEIDEFANAVDSKGKAQPPIDTDSPIWNSVMNSRMRWVEDKIARGWSQSEIEEEILNYYRRDERRSPFDFIRAEYKPPKKTNYYDLMRRRKKTDIHYGLDKYYGEQKR